MENQSGGLIYAHILNENGPSQDLGWEAISAWQPEAGLLWLHLDANDPGALAWLAKDSGLKEMTLESLLEVGTRPRHVATPDGQMIIFRGVNFNPGADPDDMVAIRMLFSQHRIITLRRNPVMAIQDIHAALHEGKGPVSAGEFLAAVAERISDRIGTIIAEIEDKVDELEDNVISSDSAQRRPELADLRRQSIGLKRYIAPQRDMLGRIIHERIDWLSDRDRIYLREVAEMTARFVEDIDATRERALIIHEEINGRLSEQMNKAMYTLSIIAAIFLPLGLLTGLLGINVGGIPMAESKSGFLIVTVSLVALAIILVALFKKIKWL